VLSRALTTGATAGVATALACALLGGCAGSTDTPKAAAASRSHGSGPSSSAGATAPARATYRPPVTAPPTVPASDRDQTTAGVFVLAWFETLNYGLATGDADPLREAVGLGCFTCANWIIEVQRQADLDLTRAGGFVHVRDLVLVAEQEDGTYTFRATLDRDPGTLTAPDGTTAPVDEGRGEVVDVVVGTTTSTLVDRTAWVVRSITAPAG
jgi:hypothetical protein